MTTTPGATDRRRLLRIYLNDHLMGAAFGTELSRRAMGNNRGSPLGSFLERLHAEIVEDRATLERLMADLDFPIDRAKMIAASVGEKVARLKLNGRLFGYSDLSRLLELEGLYAGVDTKLRLWRTLKELAPTDPRLPADRMDVMIERANSQLAGLEQHRLEAALRALR
jgi:hypothetical protein